ncbi:PQQ-like beta-propeller repeat protein [Streptomyces sp. NBC_01481]|nr:PQQ-binding-like beta-propeller repeat protein [Streptomyces sp. NBC_01481]MCX4586673.1 PQQ-like beta-propeller repeat protein [Streptomyces sp. NBC_01481]
MNATGDVSGISRRTVLRGSLGVLGLAGAAGLAGACTAEEEDGPKKRDAAWTFDGSVYGGLTVDGGTVYVPTVGPDLLYALDARTGDTRWSAKGGTSTGTEPDMVAVAAGTVFRVSQDGLVHAYRASDGKRLWRAGPLVEEGEPDRPFVLGSVLCVQLRARTDDGRVLEPGVLCGIDTASGRVLWRTDMSWLFTPDPKRGVLFRSTPDGVAACDPAAGCTRTPPPTAAGHGRRRRPRTRGTRSFRTAARSCSRPATATAAKTAGGSGTTAPAMSSPTPLGRAGHCGARTANSRRGHRQSRPGASPSSAMTPPGGRTTSPPVSRGGGSRATGRWRTIR